MARRPNANLDALTVPKNEAPPPAPPVVPSRAVPTPGNKMKAYAHTLSLRLTAEQYGRLRDYVIGQERAGAGRIAHQTVIETALAEWLDRNGG